LIGDIGDTGKPSHDLILHGSVPRSESQIPFPLLGFSINSLQTLFL